MNVTTVCIQEVQFIECSTNEIKGLFLTIECDVLEHSFSSGTKWGDIEFNNFVTKTGRKYIRLAFIYKSLGLRYIRWKCISSKNIRDRNNFPIQILRSSNIIVYTMWKVLYQIYGAVSVESRCARNLKTYFCDQNVCASLVYLFSPQCGLLFQDVEWNTNI